MCREKLFFSVTKSLLLAGLPGSSHITRQIWSWMCQKRWSIHPPPPFDFSVTRLCMMCSHLLDYNWGKGCWTPAGSSECSDMEFSTGTQCVIFHIVWQAFKGFSHNQPSVYLSHTLCLFLSVWDVCMTVGIQVSSISLRRIRSARCSARDVSYLQQMKSFPQQASWNSVKATEGYQVKDIF